MAGELSQFNEVLMRDPSMINVDNYGEGWLLEMVGTGSTLYHRKRIWSSLPRCGR